MHRLSLLATFLCLVALASANQGAYFAAPIGFTTRFGARLNVYEEGGVKYAEPYMSLNLRREPSVLKSPFGGFYAKVPLSVMSRLGGKYRTLGLRSFKAKLRSGFRCSSSCVSAAAVNSKAGPFLVLNCKRREVCKSVLDALAGVSGGSDLARNAFKFQFVLASGSASFVVEKTSLPVAKGSGWKPKLSGSYRYGSDGVLLYTVRSNSGHRVYDTIRRNGYSHMPRMHGLPSIYRSNWMSKLGEAVRLSGKKYIVFDMLKGGRTVAKLKFDVARNSRSLTSTNWFTKSRLVSSYPYDIRHKGFNFFSAAGDPPHHRRFFANFVYGNCPGDKGFVVVSDVKDPCKWGSKLWPGKAPALLYNPVPNSYWRLTGRLADRLVIYLE